MRLVPLALLVFASAAMSAPAPAAMRFVVQDENGKTLMRGRAVQLAPGRAAIPVEAYRRLGLFVCSDVPRGAAEVGMPESDYIFSFRAGSRRVLEDSGPRVYPHPMALRRNGRIHVSARLTSDAFPDEFSMTVDTRRRAIVLRRSQRFGELLRNLDKQPGGPPPC